MSRLSIVEPEGRMVVSHANAVRMVPVRYQRSELDWLIYNDPSAYAGLILNGDPKTYLKSVTEYKRTD